MQSGKLIIKHHGVEVLRENKVVLVSNSPYLDSSDNCLGSILDNKMVKRVYQELVSDESVKDELKIVEKEFSHIESNFKLAKKLIERLRVAESREELEKIYRTLLLGMNITSRKEIEKLYRKYPDVVLSIMTKSIINGYIKVKIGITIPSKIRSLEVRKVSNNESEDVVSDALDLDLTEKSSNGVDELIIKSCSDYLDEAYLRIGTQCFDCINGYVDRCEKISDYPTKKDIADYPFITDGFQWYVNDDLAKFNVIRCDNFRLAPIVPKDKNRAKAAAKAALLLMRLLYWDAVTQEEAIEKENRNKTLGYK